MDPSESPLQRIVPNLKKGKLDEIARTSYIFDRIKEFAGEYTQLDVYDNKSTILYSPQRNFSKYSKSRPDFVTMGQAGSEECGHNVALMNIQSHVQETE